LKGTFEMFCNKCVAWNTSEKLLTTFCDNLLKKVSNEKLSDETIEDTLEKVKWFAWNSKSEGWKSIHFVGYD